MRRGLFGSAACVLLAACGADLDDPDPFAGDAAEDAASDAGSADCPAGSLTLPQGACSEVWTCPVGWARDSPEGGCQVDACPAEQVPGEAGGCVSIAEPDCAVEWPEGAVFVAPGGAGDGTAEAPLGTVAEALATGRPIALLPGDHPVSDLVIDDDATLLGACPAQTRMIGELRVTGGAIRLSRLALVARAAGAALRMDGGDLTLAQVRVDGAVLGIGGQVDATDLTAHDGGWTLTGTDLDCHRCTFTEAPLDSAATADLSAIATRSAGGADAIRSSGALTLRDAQLEGAGAGLVLQGGGAHRIERVRLAGARVAVEIRGAATLVDIFITGAGRYGLHIREGADAWVEGLTVRRVKGTAVVIDGAEVALHETRIHAPYGFGVHGDHAVVGLECVHIHGVRPDRDGRADAINLFGGRLVANDLHLYENARAGLVLEDASADLRDSTIRGHRFGAVLAGDASLDERDVAYADNDRDQRSCEARCLDRPEVP